MTKVTEDQAEKQIRNEKMESSVLQKDSATSKDSWLKQTLTISYRGDGPNNDYGRPYYTAKLSYEWLKMPVLGFEDVIGITHGDNVDKFDDMMIAMHSYTDYNGNKTYNDSEYDFEVKNQHGFADIFDLQLFTPTVRANNHEGFMMFAFEQDKTNDNTADLYGHYTHALQPTGFSVAITTGSIALTGATESNATDTHIDLTY
ncbi:hypothetical protein [Mechercharimyces sp. CAU 1602]|uniref:hypothetical protein n=1 Tax=Mechercharimyces sp. CAU 1602 TaxID=2973933 RepID=UPI0021634C1E|nr:hypothetical protein [Mechercharimyces sp. CAU 1602]MCS1350060.1 hypothetical protein [Mechercharimyces sp. CAU 1602]